VADGYESYHKTSAGWKNGGGPDRFCLMPKESESSWGFASEIQSAKEWSPEKFIRHLK
jgi:AraC family transcriptional regulator